MFSYFARRDGRGPSCRRSGRPSRSSAGTGQVNLSTPFGMDWRYLGTKLNEVRQRERMLKELKKAAKGGALGPVVGTSAELRPRFVLAEHRSDGLRRMLERFEVVESYKELSARGPPWRRPEMQEIARRSVSLNETARIPPHAMEGGAGQTPPSTSGGSTRPSACNCPRSRSADAWTASSSSRGRSWRTGARTWPPRSPGLKPSWRMGAGAPGARSRTGPQPGVLRSCGELDDFLDLQKIPRRGRGRGGGAWGALKAAEPWNRRRRSSTSTRANLTQGSPRTFGAAPPTSRRPSC